VLAILIHYFADEHTRTHLDEIRWHHGGRFQFPDIVVGITFRLDLQFVRHNGKREDVNLLQCLLFFNVEKLVVQIACPRAWIADVHDDDIFGDDLAISLNDRGRIDLVDQRNIHSRANVQTDCNVRH